MTTLFRPRAWRGPSLAMQILALLLGGLIVAQLVTLLLTLVLPPEPPARYDLKDIATALRSGPRSARGLESVVQGAPPENSGRGWLESSSSREDLAHLLGVPAQDVRLSFYTPLPFAGAAAPLRRAEAAVAPLASISQILPRARLEQPANFLPADASGLADSVSRGVDEDQPRLIRASYLVLAQAAPGGGFPGGPPGGGPGGGFPGGGFPGGPGGGFPGGVPGGPAPTGVPSAPPFSPPPTAAPASVPASAPAAAPPAASQGAAPPAGSAPSQQSTRQAVAPAPIGPTGPAGAGLNGAASPGLQPPTFSVQAPSTLLPTILPPTSGRTIPQVRSAEPRAPRGVPNVSVPAAAPVVDVSPLPSPPTLAATGVGGTASPSSAAELAGKLSATLPFSDVPRTGVQRAIDRARQFLGLGPSPFVEGDFVAALRLPDGRWAVVQPRAATFLTQWQKRVALWFVIAFGLVAPLGWLFARRLSKPLDRFADAAARLGRDPSAAIAALDGPAEIGRAAHAFNLMQNRLRSFVDDRTAMVGAISHDLRTPLTRMRFRIEDAPDDLREGMLQEVDEMEQMISSVLAFIRDASTPGVRERLDLRTLLDDVAEDAALVGGDVVVEADVAAAVEVDVLGMRRLLANLVENAIKYGERARVRLSVLGDEAIASIIDDGPGLPNNELEQVFQPFYRTAAARASSAPGTGLGLAVCRSIARAHGGDVRLLQTREGFMAELRVPLAYEADRLLAA